MLQELIDKALADAGLDFDPATVERIATNAEGAQCMVDAERREALEAHGSMEAAQKANALGAWMWWRAELESEAAHLRDLANRRIAAGYGVLALAGKVGLWDHFNS